ncbi:uncharacterized protein BDR25DRAFT_57839 [Lindgomyces ingoldianus]|uniref:Uncharacterized protein n=1 Tax=Lindgomyces ingoldianus TaxID=673940 RepID=A0ACB6QNK3_9PLEO|nr:uncharacterized protein BDR25DRAFT_57839 [Lindgomyces ingoldianus]KAF2468115.1 hypothetical protein BDR25DRAFT_57839 [Lindgomyces ingoldianus]
MLCNVERCLGFAVTFQQNRSIMAISVGRQRLQIDPHRLLKRGSRETTAISRFEEYSNSWEAQRGGDGNRFEAVVPVRRSCVLRSHARNDDSSQQSADMSRDPSLWFVFVLLDADRDTAKHRAKWCRAPQLQRSNPAKSGQLCRLSGKSCVC